MRYYLESSSPPPTSCVGSNASDVAALGDMIENSGRGLTTIYITHGHADHHFGLGLLLDRFPRARPLATPGVIDYITANLLTTAD